MSLDVTTLALAKSYTNQHGGGGGGVQPDWNQNDETAKDYVKNRPFYTGNSVETVLVEESTVTFKYNGGVYMAQFQSTFVPTVGEIYNVSWDGTVYESACVDFYGMPLIGNPALIGHESDTGEPFVMLVENGQGIEISTADTSASHTLSISQCVAGEVVKIDEKFIPDVSSLIVKSSTAGSTKKFRVTVDDDYNVSATNTSDSVSKALATTEYVDNSVSNPLNITSAAVGQIAKITAVDENGKPTAWEAADMPSGGGGGGSVPAAGGVTTLHINITAVNRETKEPTFTADKTPAEMQQASVNGPIWCVVTFAAGIMSEESRSFGVPPAWGSRNEVAFGSKTLPVHDQVGENDVAFFVLGIPANDEWNIDLTAFAGD